MGEAREVRTFNEIVLFSQTNTPGRSSSDELGEAREARPFRERRRGGLGGRHAPTEKSQINEKTFQRNISFFFSQTNRPGRSSSDELGKAREVRTLNEKLIFSQTIRPGRGRSDELGEAREVRPFNDFCHKQTRQELF